MSNYLEQTLALFKPEAAASMKALGVIFTQLSNATPPLNVIQMKTVIASKRMAEAHYAAHKDQPYFTRLVTQLTRRPTIAAIIAGEGAVMGWRSLMGSFKNGERKPNEIRGALMGLDDLSADVLYYNFVHGSDSVEEAEREIRIWFPDFSELIRPYRFVGGVRLAE